MSWSDRGGATLTADPAAPSGTAPGAAAALAARLLGDLAPSWDLDPLDPGRDWAASGGLWLTGQDDGPPLYAGAGAGSVAALLSQIAGRLLAGRDVGRDEAPGVRVVGERAALAGLRRRGEISCGGASRLLAAGEGHLVLTLAREEDLELVPALVEGDLPAGGDAWAAVTAWARTRPAAEASARACLLGLPSGVVGAGPVTPGPAVLSRQGARRTPRERPRVLDLSALWAGPLSAHLLGLAGADVVKVESRRRLDGARRGPGAFYDLLHAGQRSVVLDFDDPADRARLGDLAASADIVIESSRPRALRRLGVEAEALVDQGVTWVSVTAHGRDAGADQVGFGDDVAATSGLVGRPGTAGANATGGPAAAPVTFCADALADPLTGLCAGVAGLLSLRAPRARLIDVAMDRVAAAAADVPVAEALVVRRGETWTLESPTGTHPILRPRARRARGVAPAPGAHTEDVLAGWLR